MCTLPVGRDSMPPDCGLPLLNYFIRAPKQRWRDRQPERLGSLEVDHQLELGGLFDGQVGELGTFQNLVDVHRSPAINRQIVYAIRHEATFLYIGLVWIDRGKPVLGREIDDVLSVQRRGGRRKYYESLVTILSHFAEDGDDLPTLTH